MPPKIGIVEGFDFENYKNAIEKHENPVRFTTLCSNHP